MKTANKVGFVLLPGGGMSNWLWKKLEGYLDYPFIEIDRRLKESSYQNRLAASFADCLDYIGEKIQPKNFEKIILVGHSGAGVLAGKAAISFQQSVAHVVYIAANIPKSGTTVIDALPEAVQEKNITAIKGQAEFDKIPIKTLENVYRTVFCNTCSAEDIDYVLQQDLLPEPMCAVTEKMAWDHFPNLNQTYIILANDHTLPLDKQKEMAANLDITDLRMIDSDHLVMISHPHELAEILNEIAGYYDSSSFDS